MGASDELLKKLLTLKAQEKPSDKDVLCMFNLQYLFELSFPFDKLLILIFLQYLKKVIFSKKKF